MPRRRPGCSCDRLSDDSPRILMDAARLMRVLLLGARGFVGSAVARALAGAGLEVSELARSAEAMGCGTRSVRFEAEEVWGQRPGPLFFGVNSRTRATRTRRELGCAPRHPDVVEVGRRGFYRARDRVGYACCTAANVEEVEARARFSPT